MWSLKNLSQESASTKRVDKGQSFQPNGSVLAVGLVAGTRLQTDQGFVRSLIPMRLKIDRTENSQDT